jgi:hypothetical protein
VKAKGLATSVAPRPHRAANSPAPSPSGSNCFGRSYCAPAPERNTPPRSSSPAPPPDRAWPRRRPASLRSIAPGTSTGAGPFSSATSSRRSAPRPGATSARAAAKHPPVSKQRGGLTGGSKPKRKTPATRAAGVDHEPEAIISATMCSTRHCCPRRARPASRDPERTAHSSASP